MEFSIRPARASDSEQIEQIYRPIVEQTAISFEVEPPSAGDIATRIENALKTHAWLVAEQHDTVAGYAYASQYRPRQAYRFSAETTVYVHPRYQGHGAGRQLYSALFEAIAARGFRRAFAGIALPNDASIALHRAAGFTSIGVFAEAGYKFERWHDVSWWQRAVSMTTSDPN